MKRKKTTAIVIHHSASKLLTTFEQIKWWHTAAPPTGRGWDDIGYHWVILADGTIRQGRPDDEWGTQVANFNDRSIGICLTGDFRTDYPTDQQINSLIGLLADLVRKYGLKYWNIYGHKDIKRFFIFKTTSTDCPGIHLYNRLPEIRRRVAFIITDRSNLYGNSGHPDC